MIYDLLIVGYGPVGATLAGLAVQHGLSVVVVERALDIHPLPRAAHCDDEVLRILQTVGCADSIVAGVVVNQGMDFLDAEREVLFGFRTHGTAPSGWPSSVLFHQPSFEGELRRHVSTTEAEIRLGVAVESVVECADRVEVGLADGSMLSARFVVGCDGARSTVRRSIDVAMHDLEFEEPWLVVDVVLRSPSARLPERVWQVCDPARPVTIVPMPAPRHRFEFMLLPGETPDDFTDERIVELMGPWVDVDTVEIERSAVYTFHGLIAEQWRRGRVLLAGDAAHQMPPFLGQGMCSGMRDAANLAWKIAAVVHDGADDTLLDSYQSERAPHVRSIVDLAIFFGRIICTTDPAVAAERDATIRRTGGADAQPPTPGLGAGPGIVGGGGGYSAQPMLDGVRLDDLVGPRFCLITSTPISADDPLRSWWGERAVLLDAQRHEALLPLLGGASAVLIRPDRYVFGTGSAEDLTRSAAAWLGGALRP